MTVELFEGDNRDSLRALINKGVKVHSVVCDPPYGLVSVTKRFGKEGAAAAQHGTDGAFGRFSGGFMGRQWDSTFIERDPEFWKLIWEIILPGGYCIAFSGSRTGHWQAVAMEQAGFIMHPMIGWVTGQGFPKAHNASKAIDKELTAPGSPEAAQWEGWAYGTQSLKPAMEPIYVAQKPFSEKNGALNILKHGVGAINIDGCRVPTTDDLNGGAYAEKGGRTESPSLHAGSGMNVPGKTVGRHPANLLHDGSDEAIACFPDAKGQQGDVKGTEPSLPTNEIYGQFNERLPSAKRVESDTSAARFFNALPITELDTPIHYCPKASKADRAGSRHPTVKPISLMRWLCRLVTPPGGTVLDPFGGSGSTAAAALLEGFNPILMEMEPEYIGDIKRRFGLAQPVAPSLDPDIDDLLGVNPVGTPATIHHGLPEDVMDLL